MTARKYQKRLSIAFLTLILVGCGTTQTNEGAAANGKRAPYEVSEDYNTGVIRYTVQKGDRLGDIAQEFTGVASNWRQIATHNKISKPSRLQEGQVVEIPTRLIPGHQRPTTVPVIQSKPNTTTPDVPSPTLALRKGAVEIEPVVVTPINTNRDFELNALDSTVASEQNTHSDSGTQIKVIGTYYPKGIYSEPAAYSKLMMRVAPGTQFVLVSQVNDWYRIETNTGQGYIRTSDAAIVE